MGDTSTSTIVFGVIFGAIGFAYFLYGKKQKRLVPLFSGITLMVYPYFITNPIANGLIGVALTAVPYFVRM